MKFHDTSSRKANLLAAVLIFANIAIYGANFITAAKIAKAITPSDAPSASRAALVLN